MMEFKEFMEREKLSEDDIIKAASIVTKVCKNGVCKNCPLFLFENCHAKEMTEDFKRATLRRFRKLLCPNRMDKVADLLGVKLGDWITVVNMVGETRRYHITANGLYNDKGVAVPGCLTDLLIGVAYIEKEDKNE